MNPFIYLDIICNGDNQKLKSDKFDELGAIIAYENGELDDESTIELFQHLVRQWPCMDTAVDLIW